MLNDGIFTDGDECALRVSGEEFGQVTCVVLDVERAVYVCGEAVQQLPERLHVSRHQAVQLQLLQHNDKQRAFVCGTSVNGYVFYCLLEMFSNHVVLDVGAIIFKSCNA